MISRRESAIGWTLGIVLLLIYLACPGAHHNGDAIGWARYLDEYGLAKGTILWPTVPKSEEPARTRIAEKEPGLGALESHAGWWVLWNPHHLLFLPTTAVIFRLIKHAISPLGAMIFLAWWNALACAATIMLVFRLLVESCREILTRCRGAFFWEPA